MKAFRRLPSPAMVVALAALFVALSGTAAAVTVQFARNADKVDGRHANELIRLSAMQVTADVDGWDGSLITDTRTIKAPKRGLLLITYSVDAAQDFDEATTGSGDIGVEPKLDGSTIGGVAWSTINFDTACCDAPAMTIQRVVHVAAGTHTVSMDLTGPGGAKIVYIYERSLSVLYVPFKGNGRVGRVIAPRSNENAARAQPQG